MNCWNEYPARDPSSRACAEHVNRAQLLKPINGFTPTGALVFAATGSAWAGVWPDDTSRAADTAVAALTPSNF
ncbi:hypothetical protein [Kitasatospora sp. McL0602]|uniref:hypothetical protein n=1 Tax=Kitasatospora sp. McL0602 TaxID=3439530 RepID=UPI003F89842F